MLINICASLLYLIIKASSFRIDDFISMRGASNGLFFLYILDTSYHSSDVKIIALPKKMRLQ